MADLPPALPTQFQLYNTYVLDPPWQVHYTMMWAGAAIIFTVASLPALWKSTTNGRTWQSVKGISYDIRKSSYQPVDQPAKFSSRASRPLSSRRRIRSFISIASSSLLWTPPGFNLDLGQLVILLGYTFALCFCIVFRAPLKDNPNRAGFMTLAQLPFAFLFATKNSVLSLLWQRGYERLNFLHRWAGRGMFLSATIHGAFWIQNHLAYNVPILGADKERLGVLSYLFLGIIVLTSLKPVRRFAHRFFFYTHVIGFVVFFVFLNYHTPYSVPWIYPPIALYGTDLLIRLLKYRIREGTIMASDRQMTFIQVHDCDDGWVAGQHVQIRVFFGGRVFESHPLTIINAPPAASCSSTRSILLAARATGDWTKALNRLAREADRESKVMVMLDGPYGGSSIDLGDYGDVLLVAGGSGVTFTLALLDDIVGRIVRHARPHREKTARIEFAWCIRSFGNMHWFAPMLTDIASFALNSSVALHITVYVTCLCDPESVPSIPNSDVILEKPSIRRMLRPLLTSGDLESKEAVRATGLGLAIAASGPESLTREARNAVAHLSAAERQRVGHVGMHTEVFAI